MKKQVNFTEADKIISRLKQVADKKSDVELAKVLEISAVTISGWRNRGTVPKSVLLEVNRRFGVNVEWLLTGEGATKSETTVAKVVEGKEPTVVVDDVISRMKRHTGVRTDAQLAQKLGITPNVIASWRSGKLSTQDLVNFATEYKVTVDWLVTGKEYVIDNAYTMPDEVEKDNDAIETPDAAIEIVRRLKLLTNTTTNAELAAFFDVNPLLVDDWLQRNEVADSILIETIKLYNVKLKWLLTGKGEQFNYINMKTAADSERASRSSKFVVSPFQPFQDEITLLKKKVTEYEVQNALLRELLKDCMMGNGVRTMPLPTEMVTES